MSMTSGAVSAVSANFTMTCTCGETFQVVDGQEQPHTCRPITAQQVRDAWAEGYRFARAEGRPAGEVLKEGWRKELREGLYYWDDQVPDQAIEIMERQVTTFGSVPDPVPDPGGVT